MVSKFYNLWAADDDGEMIVVNYKNPVDVATEMDTLFADKTSRFSMLVQVPVAEARFQLWQGICEHGCN